MCARRRTEERMCSWGGNLLQGFQRHDMRLTFHLSRFKIGFVVHKSVLCARKIGLHPGTKVHVSSKSRGGGRG